MITKAIITRLPDIGSNLYYVRIPYLEKAGVSAQTKNTADEYEATSCHSSGAINEYKAGDVVFVAFEDHKVKPVIIGKLFIDAESETSQTAMSLTELSVSGKTILPLDTTIGNVKAGELLSLLYAKATSGGGSFLSGSGVPTSALGNNGDAYMDLTNGDLYNKEGGVWSKVGSAWQDLSSYLQKEEAKTTYASKSAFSYDSTTGTLTIDLSK